jgi:prepilin-type N-terminal cleavage/methylation domain-containing protein
MHKRSQTQDRRGFSLIELVGATAILSVIIGTVGLIQMRGHDAERARLAHELAETVCSRALERVAEELKNVDPQRLPPELASERGASSLTYQHLSGSAGPGSSLRDTRCRLALQLAPGEFENDLDDNGDGLVDERRLVLTCAVGAPHPVTIDLCNGVPQFASGEAPGGEPGFWMRRSGDQLTIHLTVRIPCAHGAFASSSQQTNVALHD